MLTEKRMQKVLDKLIKSIQVETDILDIHGMIVASSEKARLGQSEPNVRDFLKEAEKSIFIDAGKTYMRFHVDKSLIFFLSMEGTNRVTRNYCLLTVSLIEVYLKSMLQKIDKEEIMRRILLNQLGEMEFQEMVRDYKLELGLTRCVFLVKTTGMDADSVYQILVKAFPRNQGDTLVLVDGMTVALIKAITDEMEDDELYQLAAAMEETILNEISIKAYIGIGTLKDNIFQLKESYSEAVRAIEVGKVYNSNHRIYLYDVLLLERFLFEVPLELCEVFSKNVFAKEFKKVLNEEMLATIEKFFENSLNLSETARQLFIHRNTLVYRLDKIQKVMRLDLRNFHDAVTFKIMTMLMERGKREGSI